MLPCTPKLGHLFLESGVASCRHETNAEACAREKTYTEKSDHKDSEPCELHKSRSKCSPASLLEHS